MNTNISKDNRSVIIINKRFFFEVLELSAFIVFVIGISRSRLLDGNELVDNNSVTTDDVTRVAANNGVDTTN